ncbi:hypothetical protein FHY13_003606 [Xanthomonas arboricola]|nr:hypothetical protein [Xanthomonas euroxanthea]
MRFAIIGFRFPMALNLSRARHAPLRARESISLLGAPCAPALRHRAVIGAALYDSSDTFVTRAGLALQLKCIAWLRSLEDCGESRIM